MNSGIYIVTLNNEEPISVNANDSRIAHQAIKVTRANCKVGKAKNFELRKRQYDKVFGEHNVNFKPIALVDGLNAAEQAILAKLDAYRVRGRTGRKNEWLENIGFDEVMQVVYRVLNDTGIQYKPINI